MSVDGGETEQPVYGCRARGEGSMATAVGTFVCGAVMARRGSAGDLGVRWGGRRENTVSPLEAGKNLEHHSITVQRQQTLLVLLLRGWA